MGTQNLAELHLCDRDTNTNFDLVEDSSGITIVCTEWFPQRVFVPREVWESFIRHPQHGTHCDTHGYRWDWTVGGDFYASVSVEKLNGIDQGRKNVLKIPKSTWHKMVKYQHV